ncbi:MAG TPA: OHCU decarboxylase [Blastocatellia bacterium]|nr:OHCU decarboxylase [Blastocatellia bacterium]
MNQSVNRLNELSANDAYAEFLKCCGSTKWAQEMTAARPFATEQELFTTADDISSSLEDEDWLEAFRAHPKIGERKAATAQSHQEQKWSAQEQSGVSEASAGTISQLAERNREYEDRFGFIFIVCASGKSPDQMLAILNSRIDNDPRTELRIASEEQIKITRLRLEKLLNP